MGDSGKREPIFEKCSHLPEKGGVLMLFKTALHLGAKAQYHVGTCNIFWRYSCIAIKNWTGNWTV